MRVLKDHKYESILEAARIEFINHGFKDTSMRTIASRANVGLSNIYNYYQNKDELFLAIVRPAKEVLFHFVSEQHTEDKYDINRELVMGHNTEIIEQYIKIIFKYKQEYRLLLYSSDGSSMSNFRDELTDHLTNITIRYMDIEQKRVPGAKRISPFFIHTIASWLVSILGEVVTHNLSKQKLKNFFEEYFRFVPTPLCGASSFLKQIYLRQKT